MKRIYWDTFEFNNKKFFFTVSDFGLNFISNPNVGVSEVFDFYSKEKFEFRYQEQRTAKCKQEINEYLMGQRMDFELQLDFDNVGDEVEQRVWHAVQQIKYGKTIDLNQLMNQIKIGNRNAVINALATCPIMMVVPLHRVIVNDDRIRGGQEFESLLRKLESLDGINDMHN